MWTNYLEMEVPWKKTI